LYLKLDEIIHAEPEAREDVRGVERQSEAEIRGLSLEEADPPTENAGRR